MIGRPENRSRNQMYWSRTLGSSCRKLGSGTNCFGGMQRIISSIDADEVHDESVRSARFKTASNRTRISSYIWNAGAPNRADSGSASGSISSNWRHSDRLPESTDSVLASGAIMLMRIGANNDATMSGSSAILSKVSASIPRWLRMAR